MTPERARALASRNVASTAQLEQAEQGLAAAQSAVAQTRAQLNRLFGEDEARSMIGLTNNLVVFGGSKDVRFNQELSDLMGDVRVARHSWQSGTMAGRSTRSRREF